MSFSHHRRQGQSQTKTVERKNKTDTLLLRENTKSTAVQSFQVQVYLHKHEQSEQVHRREFPGWRGDLIPILPLLSVRPSSWHTGGSAGIKNSDTRYTRSWMLPRRHVVLVARV